MSKNAPEAIVIPLSKGKALAMLFGSLVFIVLAVGIWWIADLESWFDLLFLRSVALVGGFFFGLCALYGVIKLFDCSPGLIIDAEGIVDNSSAVAVGRIPWSEVKWVRVTVIQGQRFVTLGVIDPQAYLERGGLLKRQLNSASVGMTGSPINISSHSLRVSFDELLRVLTEAFERSQGTHLGECHPGG